jgi:hypothetical protein
MLCEQNINHTSNIKNDVSCNVLNIYFIFIYYPKNNVNTPNIP